MANRYGPCTLSVISGGKGVEIPVDENGCPILVFSFSFNDGLLRDRAYEVEIGAGGGLKLQPIPRPVGGHDFAELNERKTLLKVHGT